MTIEDPEMLEQGPMAKLKEVLAVGEREGVFQTKRGASGVQAEARLGSATDGIQHLPGLRAGSSDQSASSLENDAEM